MPTSRGAADVMRTRSKSFNGRAVAAAAPGIIRRQMTAPDRMNGGDRATTRLSKVLMNVTVQGGVGAVQVLMNPELTVRDLIEASLKQYVKERRRLPVVDTSSVDDFDLHYSQFSLESLDKKEKLARLGSRNFFMCRRRRSEAYHGGLSGGGTTAVACSKAAAEKVAKPWFKLISFLF